MASEPKGPGLNLDKDKKIMEFKMTKDLLDFEGILRFDQFIQHTYVYINI